MGSTRRSFTEEYKEEAVTFVIDGGRSIAEVARNIGCHEMTLGKWVRRVRDARDSALPPDAELTISARVEFGVNRQRFLIIMAGMIGASSGTAHTNTAASELDGSSSTWHVTPAPVTTARTKRPVAASNALMSG